MKILIVTENKNHVSTGKLRAEAQSNGHAVTIIENKELYNLISKFDAVVSSEKLSEKEIKKEIEKTNPRSFEAQKRETARLTFRTNK